MDCPPTSIPLHSRYMAYDVDLLASLASQHHKSSYSQAKYGVQGHPVPYTPLSLHSPDYYALLVSRQQQTVTTSQPWFLNRCISKPPGMILGPCGSSVPQDVPNLEDELVSAMSDSLEIKPVTPAHIKTSTSHPISISHIIPDLMIPLISSNALFAPSHDSPTVLDILPSFTLDKLMSQRDGLPRISHFIPRNGHHGTPPDGIVPPVHFPPHQPPLHPGPLERIAVSEALHMAIGSDVIDFSDAPPLPYNQVVVDNPLPVLPSSLPMNLPVSPTLPSVLAEPLRHTPLSEREADIVQIFSPQEKSPMSASDDLAPLSILQPPSDVSEQLHELKAPPVEYFEASPPPLAIGNLLLSSCPGKKVRLQGPVKGRPAVCRDLDTDLARIKDFGVGCIVCCLDDTELGYLGVPWPEYSSAIQRAGIDLLRIPTPEGLAPLSNCPATLDDHLTRLIETYTLRGVSVLVHCRGGVGRAGVVACGWMLKLGLCGWLSRDANASTDLRRQEVVGLVARVIEVVRRRRSPKAIETYEQVRFLVEFVEHLQDGRRRARRAHGSSTDSDSLGSLMTDSE